MSMFLTLSQQAASIATSASVFHKRAPPEIQAEIEGACAALLQAKSRLNRAHNLLTKEREEVA